MFAWGLLDHLLHVSVHVTHRYLTILQLFPYNYTVQVLTYTYTKVSLIESPGRPGTPFTGEQSDLDVARSAALGLWSCSKSKSNKLVRLAVIDGTYFTCTPVLKCRMHVYTS